MQKRGAVHSKAASYGPWPHGEKRGLLQPRPPVSVAPVRVPAAAGGPGRGQKR